MEKKRIIFMTDVNGGEYSCLTVVRGNTFDVKEEFWDEKEDILFYPVEVDGFEILFDEPVTSVYVDDELSYARMD